MASSLFCGTHSPPTFHLHVLGAADGSSEYSGGWRNEQRHGYGVLYQVRGCTALGNWHVMCSIYNGRTACLYVLCPCKPFLAAAH